MPYDVGILAGLDRTVQYDFEKVEGALVDADLLLRLHHMYLCGLRIMLKSTNGDKVLAVRSASSCLEVLSHAHLRRQIGQRSDVQNSRCTVFYKRFCYSAISGAHVLHS